MDLPPPKPKSSFVDVIETQQRLRPALVEPDEMLVYLKNGTSEVVPGVKFVVSKDCIEAVANALKGRKVAVDTKFKCSHLTQWDANLQSVVGPTKKLSVFVVGRQIDSLRNFVAWREGESGLFTVPPEAAAYYMNRCVHVINGKANVKRVWQAYDPYQEAARQICNRIALFGKINSAFRRVLSIVLSAMAIAGVSA